jgi:NhaA family Na+:H+ antiporter
LPVVAAVGGMAAPALVHVAFNVGRPGVRGWGVPMATDVAFAMALVALLARWVPPELRLFLLSLAVADDVGAVLVIAAVYSGGISWAPVAVAVAVLALMAALWRLGRRGLALHAALAVVVWLAVDRSGVHPTIAGVALGMLAPARPTAERLEAALAPLSTFLVLPLFGLANAGVVVSSRMLQPPGAGAVAVGVAVGLVAGKIVGITGATWLAQRVGLAPPPDPCRGRVLGIAAVAGIGFTVSLFVTNLAFADPALASAARLGILAGSAVAALVGAVALLRAGRVEPAA